MQRLEGVDGSVWTTADFPGKRPEMDVGFGLRPDNCYSKLVKVKFVTRNSSRPLQYAMPLRFVLLFVLLYVTFCFEISVVPRFSCIPK